jgi:hypothetical protein
VQEASRSSTRATGAELSRNCDPAGTGTPRAIKDKVLSAATSAPSAAQITRTRAKPKIGRSRQAPSEIERSRKGRRSTALRLSEVRNIIAAAEYSEQQHRPLNRHLTIHFGAAEIANPVRATGQYLKLAGDWLRTQGASLAYIWVRESGASKGEHVHILMHVPPNLIAQFALRERGWRKRIGAKRALGAFRSTPIGRSYRHGETGIQFGELYSDALAGIVGYLVKGAEPRAVSALRLTRAQPGGGLWGKRSGMSENIGRAARRRAGLLK